MEKASKTLSTLSVPSRQPPYLAERLLDLLHPVGLLQSLRLLEVQAHLCMSSESVRLSGGPSEVCAPPT